MIDVSIIIVSYNSLDEILTNIKSVKENITSMNYEILVVNNCAQDRQISAALKDCAGVTLIEAEENLGFGRANNLGLQRAKGKYILFANPDVIFLSDINKLTDMLERDPEIGLTGPLTYDGSGKVLPSCGEYPTIKNIFSYYFFLNNLFPKIRWWGNFPMKYFDFRGSAEADWISGAFMLGRRSTLKRIGGFDKDFFMYGEDIDICWRLKKAGFKIIFSDKASIIHNVGHSVQSKSASKAQFFIESSRVLWGKHYSPRTVRQLFIILCLGAFMRKVAWRLLYLTGLSQRENMCTYYGTLVSGSIHNLRGGNNL